MKPAWPAHAVCFGLIVSLAACGKAPKPKPTVGGHPLSAPLVSKCDPGQPGGTLTLTTVGIPLTLNPVLAMDPASDEAVRLLFSSLVTLDLATQEVGPGLAESWSVEPDQKTWTFKLRNGLHWSDGQPLKSDDVVFTWNEVLLNPDFNRTTYDLFRIGDKNFEVSKVDDLTVRVVTPEPYAPFLEYVGNAPVLPKHAIGRAVQERRFLSVFTVSSRPERVVGSGPFRLKGSQPGKYVWLERNPEYPVVDKQGRRLPYFDEVLLAPTASPAMAAMLFLNGKCDVFERAKPEDFEPFRRAVTNASMRLVDLGVGTERDFLWFNLNTGADAAGKPYVNPVRLNWFRNKKFRQAISCALDRDRIVREVYGGRAEPMHGLISVESRKWNNANIPRYAYDPARARALLAEIGMQDRNNDGVLEDTAGHTLEFTLSSNKENPLRQKCAAFIAEDLRKLGINAAFLPLDFQTLIGRINNTFDFECVLMGLAGGGSDPASQANVLKSSEPLHQWFPNQRTPSTEWERRIDELMDVQMRTLDFAQRKAHFDEVQVIMAEELPMIPIIAPFHFAVIRADIGNVRPSVLTPYRLTWNVEELYFKKP